MLEHKRILKEAREFESGEASVSRLANSGPEHASGQEEPMWKL